MAPKKKAKQAAKAKGKQQPAAGPSAAPPAAPKPLPKKGPAKKSGGGVVHAGLDGDLDVEGYAKGLLQEGDHTPDGWGTVELFVNHDKLEYLPSLP